MNTLLLYPERMNVSASTPLAGSGVNTFGRSEFGVVRIVDDNAETCASLRFFLESLGYSVKTWTDPLLFLDEWQNDKAPGCILLDIRMPGMSGLELLDALTAARCCLPILFLTGHGDIEMAVRAMKRGAVDFLLKPPEEGRIVEAVEKATALGLRLFKENGEAQLTLTLWEKLTQREREVMALVAKGLMNKQIASVLGISEKTVQQHRGAASRKLQVRNAVEAAEYLAAVHCAEARLKVRPDE